MDIDYDALFGTESEKTEETAETPAGETVEETEAATAEETAGEKESEPAEQTEQSKEENARYAAIRRKAEEEANAKAQRLLDEAFASSGLTNPYTGKAIQNKADFDEYSKAISKEKVDGMLEKTGMSEDELQAFVNQLPDVKAARKAKEDLDRQQQKIALDSQIAEVGKIDPAIKSVEDIQKLDNYREIYGYVMKGLSIPDAYKLANFDKLSGRAASAAKQAALNAKAGKDHLTTTQSRGDGAQTVPPDVMAMYKSFNPKATEAEITAHYNKSHRKG